MSLLAALLALLPSASALDLKWWGVGPSIGTMAIPTRYPASLPTVAQDEVDKVKGDVALAMEGVLYPSGSGRVFGRAGVGLGTSGWTSPELVVGWDQILFKDEEFQLLFGGGIGYGSETFHDAQGEDFLRVSYFPLRAQMSALLRDKPRAYEIDIYGTYHIVGEQLYCTSRDQLAADGCVTGAEGGGLIAGAVYLGIGAEATLYFGDFRSKGKNKKKKKR